MNGKVKADLGAGWIHGITNNPITALAKQAGVPLAKVASDYEDTVTFLPNGNEATAAQDNRCEDPQFVELFPVGCALCGRMPLSPPCPHLELLCPVTPFLPCLALQVGRPG